MPFPVTKRYFLDFRNSDTGLTPTFTFFQQTPGFGATTPASPAGGIVEKSNGRYYFDWIWLTKADSDIVFQADGGASIPTEEVRYIKGTISPRDAFLDEPVSQIVDDVWDEATTAHVVDGSFGQTLQLLTYGTATAGAATTITLAAGASATNNFYNNALLVITDGLGVGQARTITAYVGGTKVATVDRAWGTNPNATSKYMIVPAAQAPLDTATIADAVWDEALAGHLTVGSTGEKLNTGVGGGGGGVSFLSNGDTVNPIIVQVASPKHTQVKVTFSEPVVMTTGANGALNLLNYDIPGLTIIAISSLTAQQVLITTSAQTPNFLYNLSVINVEDLIGNPIL